MDPMDFCVGKLYTPQETALARKAISTWKLDTSEPLPFWHARCIFKDFLDHVDDSIRGDDPCYSQYDRIPYSLAECETNPQKENHPMKTRALFTALCLAAMLLAQGTVKATSIILTENPSFTATFGDLSTTGITVTPGVNGDTWTVDFSPSLGLFKGAKVFGTWFEPPGESGINLVSATGESELAVQSDIVDPFPADVPVPDGTSFGFGNGIHVTFTEKTAAGGPKSVPDAGSTLALLGIALIGIGFVRAKISPLTLAG
jgi:hypothetical protein